jgi:hypothetical protein
VPADRHSPVKAFTLIEMILGLAITTILLAAMGSLVLVASRSIPDRGRATDMTSAAAGTLEQFSADIAAAESIAMGLDTGIEVKVPDRDSDGKQEEIRYEWPGTPGASLDRVYNGVHTGLELPLSDFNLAYTVTTASTSSASVVTSLPESYVGGWTGGLLYTTQQVQSGKPVAQHFVPTLPANARSWTITRIRFMVQGEVLAATGTTSVQIRTVGSDGMPTGTILASASIAESSLNLLLHAMTQVSFTGVPPLAPGQEVALTFSCSNNCPSMMLGYVALSTAHAVPMSVYSGTWSSTGLKVIPHEVYATITSTAPQTATAKRLERVTGTLQLGGSPTPLRTTVTLFNAPEVQ